MTVRPSRSKSSFVSRASGCVRRGVLPYRVFFFQAEDGIRDIGVTGVQTCALPIFEISEFTGMIRIGAGPQRSAFLSSFFTLVGCHGAHVTAGLLWIGTMMAQIWAKGFRSEERRVGKECRSRGVW